MIEAEGIKKLLLEGEGLNLEMKKCKRDSLPESLWETYSAFANTRGGIILLGVTEDKKKPRAERFEITGVGDANKLVTDLFNMLHNPQKVNRCVMVDSDIQIVNVDGNEIIYIHVPEADYRQKPIYINRSLQDGTYKRLHEGDRHVTHEELAMLLRDSTENIDAGIIEFYGMDDIDSETLRKYRQSFKNMNPGHAYESLDDKDFLIQMGGYSVDRHENKEGLTMAGLLMFGKSLSIHENFRNFRVDYLDLIGIEPGSSKKWNDRLTDDGRWVDNIYNFLIIALNKLLFTLPSEGRLKGVLRVDGGELYEGVREAFINSLTYCDYRLGGVLRIDRRTDRIVMRNPGCLRISPERIYNGDYTQARNSTIQKMLRMVGFGDNIGSGFQKIMKAWESLNYPAPTIHEEPDVNEVWLTLPLPLEPSTLNVKDEVPINDPIKEGETVNDSINEIVKETLNTDKDTETSVGLEKGTEKGIEMSESARKGIENNPESKGEIGESTQEMGGSTQETGDSTQETGDSTQETGDSTQETGDSTQEKPTNKERLLSMLRENPHLTLNEVAESIGLTRDGVKKIADKLRAEGILSRKGSTKAGEWIVNKNPE